MKDEQPIRATSKDDMIIYHTNHKTKYGNFMIIRQEILSENKKYCTIKRFYGYKSQRATNQAMKTKIWNLDYKIEEL